MIPFYESLVGTVNGYDLNTLSNMDLNMRLDTPVAAFAGDCFLCPFGNHKWILV